MAQIDKNTSPEIEALLNGFILQPDEISKVLIILIERYNQLESRKSSGPGLYQI